MMHEVAFLRSYDQWSGDNGGGSNVSGQQVDQNTKLAIDSVSFTGKYKTEGRTMTIEAIRHKLTMS